MSNYQKAALGGTFDHFHQGHQALINHALTIAENVVIGVTSETMTTAKKNGDSIEPFTRRFNTVKEYLISLKASDRVNLIELTTIFGSTLDDLSIDCLVLSPLTVQGGNRINQKREELKLPPLAFELCSLVKDSQGEIISSTRIREGSINRNGFVYKTLLNDSITLSEAQKQALKEPWGRLVPNSERLETIPPLLTHTFNVVVGDATSLFCLENNLLIHSFIFDNHIERQPSHILIQDQLQKPILHCSNQAGTINKDLSRILETAFTNHQSIQVDGEEDIAVTPSILLLPLGSTILYGQPGKGLVVVRVTEEVKEKAKELLEK